MASHPKTSEVNVIKYKNPYLIDQYRELERINYLLYDIVYEIGEYFDVVFEEHVVLTSIIRKQDKGVHGCWRGVDIRAKNFKEEQLISIELFINKRYQYDPNRPELKVLLIHGEGDNKHMHIQTHPNTRAL